MLELPACLINILEKGDEYGLKVTAISNDTLLISNKIIRIDEWMCIYDPDEDLIVIKHMNKSRKVTHHTQCKIAAFNWEWVLERISQHDDYIIECRGTYSPVFNLI